MARTSAVRARLNPNKGSMSTRGYVGLDCVPRRARGPVGQLGEGAEIRGPAVRRAKNSARPELQVSRPAGPPEPSRPA